MTKTTATYGEFESKLQNSLELSRQVNLTSSKPPPPGKLGGLKRPKKLTQNSRVKVEILYILEAYTVLL